MKLNENDLKILAETAILASKEAGALIAEYTGRKVDVINKAGGSTLASQVLTEVDLLSQEKILQIIKPTSAKYNLALLTEESIDDHSRLEKDYFWCIDPLDGTLPFTEGTPGYAVAIALVSRDGVPQIGAVFDPVDQNLYHAVKGQGAYKNGESLQLKSVTELAGSPLIFVTDRSFTKHPRFDEILSDLEVISAKMGLNGVDLIKHGGAAMNACWVLENAPACYFKFPKPQEGGGSLWDYAATAAIFSEAGAPVSDIWGQPLDLNRSGSTFMNHGGILYASHAEIAECIKELYVKFV